ncbi:MAG: site-specific DNA-methyltransferase [Clostridium sp.]|nr:site-specific DNA-methyltransferase [Clostridium sp.]MCM1208304.1 site-specific DNA-methyltransferase [Ruminococcus sp.]
MKNVLELDNIYNLDCIKGMKKIDNETIDLMIADPPYFKVVNEKWDYTWKTEEDYIKWSIKWFQEAFRILRIGGSFYLFGYFRMLSLLVPYLQDIGFEIRQEIIIDKGMQAVSGRATKKYKMFPNTTESILFLVKDNKPYVKKILKDRQKELGLKAYEINERLGVKSNGGGMWSIYTGNNICKQFPTESSWNKLMEILDLDIDYKKISITFNPTMKITSVWTDINFYEEKRIHPTQKPLKLIERLIYTSSNENDIILDPFMGSGATAVGAVKMNRRYIGFELDKEYCDKAINRVEKEKKN